MEFIDGGVFSYAAVCITASIDLLPGRYMLRRDDTALNFLGSCIRCAKSYHNEYGDFVQPILVFFHKNIKLHCWVYCYYLEVMNIKYMLRA
jgi:hypothetical protein